MPPEIILFSSKEQPKSEQVVLNPFRSDLIKIVEERKSSVVCLIEDKWLIDLQKNIDQFLYKGEKHPKKPLTYYFRKNAGKILFINGCKYSGFSQLKRSINDFLKNAMRNKFHSLYFIVISKEFFEMAKEETTYSYSLSEAKKEKYRNPMLNMIRHEDTKVDLKERYIGNSEPCLLVRQMIAIAARHDFPVLILGETGTGKEVVARNIHECSDRSGNPFVSINCGAIPTELFESEIFGYKKGAFTGAVNDKKGLWEMATGGTLFLDEIGDLALNNQVKILKALDKHTIMPVGGLEEIPVDARIIAATNKNIESLVTEKSTEFRNDLYYRISTYLIFTPPLSNHPEDIPELAGKFWKKWSDNKLPEEVLNQLECLNWPGNVRSLKHFLHRLYALFGTGTITQEHVRVLQLQDLDNFLKPANDVRENRKPVSDIDFEKAIMKIEYLLKASLYCEGEENRRELLEKVRESLGLILNSQ